MEKNNVDSKSKDSAYALRLSGGFGEEELVRAISAFHRVERMLSNRSINKDVVSLTTDGEVEIQSFKNGALVNVSKMSVVRARQMAANIIKLTNRKRP